jgi:hypothetical protein
MLLKNAGNLLKKFFAPAIENIAIDYMGVTEFGRTRIRRWALCRKSGAHDWGWMNPDRCLTVQEEVYPAEEVPVALHCIWIRNGSLL